jgi:predicted RecA/RadA family phage recombinase
MKNYVNQGVNLTIAAPYDRSSGEGALVGTIFGVAQEDVTSGNDVVLVRRGVFELAKVSAQAWTLGAKLYWDDTAKNCTTTASGNTLIGAAAAAAANPSATGTVLLDGTIR